MTAVFDVFLSHNSKGRAAVHEIAEALRARGFEVWVDAWDLVPGQRWREVLEESMETIQSFAVLVGEDGPGLWQDAETRGCLARFVDRKPMIPVLLPCAPEEPGLPHFLRMRTWVDLREGVTEEGLDRLQWAAIGRRPDRAKRLATPIAETNEARAGQAFTEPFTGIRFLWIPGGRFQMGGDVFPHEKPVHRVRLSPFWLGETPVTNRQYGVFLEKSGAEEPEYWRDCRFPYADQPVVGVSWDDAVAFCRWLSEATDRRIVLPSEAQWEFAARGTDGREYPWGDERPDASRACFGLGTKGRAAPVGSFPDGRGPFGTLDQAGNVCEWCRDAWDAAAYAKREDEPLDPVVDRERGGAEVGRILRGGGWFGPDVALRSACRCVAPARSGSFDFGFRVAAVPPVIDS